MKRRVGEIVLIYYRDQPSLFARIEAVEPDVKKDWYQLKLLMLTVPTQMVTWILRESYIDGENFTMGGVAMRLEPVNAPSQEPVKAQDAGRGEKGKVIPFDKRKTE